MVRWIKYLVWLLVPLGAIHLFIVYVRNKLYDWQIFKSKRLPKPVISIGNLQMGGTGKTPLAIGFLNKLQNEGLKVGVLSRGYKRKSHEEVIILKPGDAQVKNIYDAVGDEPVLLLKELRDGTLGIGTDRFRVGQMMLEQNPIDLFLLDDGLQHRKLHREIDICLIDVSRWRNHPLLFPFSYLRDCKSSLKRCDGIILTRIGDQRGKANKIKKEITDKYSIPVFEGSLQPNAIVNIINGNEINPSKMKGEKAAVFCGIANPRNFFTILKREGLDLVLIRKFPNHHNYDIDDLGRLAEMMKQKNVSTAITTEKDAVKLKGLIQEIDVGAFEYFFLRAEFVIKEKDEVFDLIFGLLPS